ncbi:MAG: hypothetical protein ACO1SV_22810 [Fimbriimonas sp.]
MIATILFVAIDPFALAAFQAMVDRENQAIDLFKQETMARASQPQVTNRRRKAFKDVLTRIEAYRRVDTNLQARPIDLLITNFRQAVATALSVDSGQVERATTPFMARCRESAVLSDPASKWKGQAMAPIVNAYFAAIQTPRTRNRLSLGTTNPPVEFPFVYSWIGFNHRTVEDLVNSSGFSLERLGGTRQFFSRMKERGLGGMLGAGSGSGSTFVLPPASRSDWTREFRTSGGEIALELLPPNFAPVDPNELSWLPSKGELTIESPIER